jgi:hypothetical protein
MSVSRSASAVLVFTAVAAPAGSTQAQEVHGVLFVAQPVATNVVTDASINAAMVRVIENLLVAMTRTRVCDPYAEEARPGSGGHLVVGIEHNG